MGGGGGGERVCVLGRKNFHGIGERVNKIINV